jgi:hypothetical protein
MHVEAESLGRIGGPSYSREAWAREVAKLAIAFHVTMRLANAGAIARTKGALRLASEIVLRCGKYRGLVAHRVADTHLHAVLVGTREQAGLFARCVEGALRKRLRLVVPFERCRIWPIHDERHLLHALRYVLRQEDRHGTAFDEAHDGSSLPDLIGLRFGADWLWPRLHAVLPRLTQMQLREWVELPALDGGEVDLRLLGDASAAAWGVGSLRGASKRHASARRAAVHLLDRIAPRAGAASLLGLPSRSVVRYRSEPFDAAAVRVVERQLRLRTRLQERRAAAASEAPAGPATAALA